MQAATAGRKVLIVDAHANAAQALAELLRDEGFVVETAANEAEAMDRLAGFRPEVVIADLLLPGGRGLELIGRLREGRRAPEVIALTALGEHAAAVEALRAGALAYLAAPVHVDELMLVLDKVLEHIDLGREVQRLRRRAPSGTGRRLALVR